MLAVTHAAMHLTTVLLCICVAQYTYCQCLNMRVTRHSRAVLIHAEQVAV